MRVLIDQLRRVGRIGLGIALGILSLGILVAAWNGARTRASVSRISPSTSTTPANVTETLAPIQMPVCVAPPSGMISWWTGDDTADDLQDGNHGTLVNGATFAPGMVGQAFSLDGVNDRVDVPDADNLDLTSQMTIDAWINPTALGGSVVDKITTGGSDGYMLDTFAGKVRFRFGSQTVSGSTTLQTNIFTHVAVTYDFTNLNVYVNGVLDGTLLAEELALPPNDRPLRIGADQTGATAFSGLIDEVEIFNRALSELEIQSIVAAGSAGKCKDVCALTCPSDIVQPNDKGQCGALVNFAPTGSACGGITCVPPSDSFFAVGTTGVTCTASAGPICSFNVTVIDNTPPSLNSCPGSVSVSTNGACEVVNYATPTAVDNCGSATVSCAPPSGFCFPIGMTTVICTASDASPDSPDAECQFTVTVDACPIACPADITLNNDPNQCGAVVTFSATAPPACGTVVCTVVSGSFFHVGTSTVECSTPQGGNCSFTVTINDTQAPTISCPANVTQPNDPGQCAAVVNWNPIATASDNCPGVATPTCTPPSGSSFPKGVTTVTCSVVDASGNNGSCMFTVTVNDTQPPTIICPAGVTAVTPAPGQPGTVVTFSPPVTSDNCPGVTASCSPPSGSTFPVGTSTVTCTATDASGNTATCSFGVMTFDVCLQDESSPNRVLLFNSMTGDYVFCCGQFTLSGTGSVTKQGGNITLQHNTGDRRVLGKVSATSKSGSASLQSPPGVMKCTITDRDTRNNTCSCGGQAG